MGDGSAPSVVGTVVVCPEDALLTGSQVARSESGRSVGSAVGRSEDGLSVGSSEPPQASSSNGRSSARAKIPRKSRESLGQPGGGVLDGLGPPVEAGQTFEDDRRLSTWATTSSLLRPAFCSKPASSTVSS